MSGITMVLIGFSRNFLGVHAPQDVVVGLVVGLLVMLLMRRVTKWIVSRPGSDVFVLFTGMALCLAVAIYASVKPYPTDYNAEGQLIVDGAKMASDTFKAVGYCGGILVGCFLERRYLNFSTDIPAKQRLARAVVGLMGFYVVGLILAPIVKKGLPGFAGAVLSCFLQLFYVSFLFPLCIVKMEQNLIPESVEA